MNDIRHKDLPVFLQKYGFPFSWGNEKVWALNIPTAKLDIHELEWHFDLPFWNHNNADYTLHPRKVLENPKQFPEHYKRILDCNTTYPIDIMQNNGRWTILDGLHRTAKAHVLKKKQLEVRKIPHSAIPTISIIESEKD